VLLLGSEGAGVPQDLVDRCDDAVAIPMQGTAESLNLATAAAVLLYELKRRRDRPHD
jgi:TrmH family RNA methyltransferase